jgi:cell division protein ZapA (FtsZ GTPase activity inhibitor)
VYCIAKQVIHCEPNAQMGEISIKINIADRVYPLKINMEEEEVVRRAAKLINDRIKELQEKYAVKDKQDLLSMCVLHYASASINAEKKASNEDTDVAEKVYQLDSLLNDFFTKAK